MHCPRDLAAQCESHGKRRSRETAWRMSQENVEIVRHLYESGLFDRDPEELLKLADLGR